MIRVVYHTAAPQFPATDQHPDAVRYKIGAYIVDAIGGPPTPEEVQAFIAPPTVKPTTLEDVVAVLAQKDGGFLTALTAQKAVENEPMK